MIARSIARYGVRSVPGDEKEVVAAFRRGEAVNGPAIAEFERAFAAYHGMDHAIAASFGRMAFHYILRALDLPAGSEIVFPALTFWAVPEIARQSGLKPVFVDVDRATFNLDPGKVEAALTEHTRAIVPTHLYGQPCSMTEIMRIAERHNLTVIEDCAQAVGARYRGRRVGTFGAASFFSFQMLKGLNTYGGGMALTNDAALARRVREQVQREPDQRVQDLAKRFASGYAARVGVSPKGFTFWGFPLLCAASLFGHYDLSKLVWERIRPLNPFPRSYRQKYSNVQALLGLRGLKKLDEFNARSRQHAAQYTRGLADCPQIQTPRVCADVEHVFYQYCIYTVDPAQTSRGAIRRGVDIETTHVDVCSKLGLFEEFAVACPGAEATERALQLPVYARLRESDIDRVLQVVRAASVGLQPINSEAMGLQCDEMKQG
ncbi:MAG TPA: aminotransferase class I/II-fold pyridoxal phosphate-dependent enzyme [Pyrinomonadaceae bacterium]|nr:aminotransferase class I/II-fold pyridoxal phosphate-dependent enzyme [Pyrinomonadaceae bacterium]